VSIYRYESIVIGMIFGPLIVIAAHEIIVHIRWMREQRRNNNQRRMP